MRQGRLAVYPSSHGQEACQVAAVACLRPATGSSRPTATACRSSSAASTRSRCSRASKGDWHCGYDPTDLHVAPQATPPATQLLHAVGVGHAARLEGEDTVVMAQCGDGATREGDFHEALNFAAVFKAPVVQDEVQEWLPATRCCGSRPTCGRSARWTTPSERQLRARPGGDPRGQR